VMLLWQRDVSNIIDVHVSHINAPHDIFNYWLSNVGRIFEIHRWVGVLVLAEMHYDVQRFDSHHQVQRSSITYKVKLWKTCIQCTCTGYQWSLVKYIALA